MIRFLLRNSRWMLVFSMLTGLISGLAGAGLIVVINKALEPEQPADLTGIFAGLCLLLVVARVLSALLLVRLVQNTALELRLQLSRIILSVPLTRLQKLGPAQILACLTEDVATLANSFQCLPSLCVNTAIIGGCLVYLGWLSWIFFSLVAITLFLGIASFSLINNRALRALSMAREYDDAMYGHFRSLTQGIKELKLHGPRRNEFVKECLESAATHYRRHYVSGMDFFILASNWGSGLFYVLIGIGLFALPDVRNWAGEVLNHVGRQDLNGNVSREMTPQVLRGFCLTILYMMSPMVILVDSLSIFGKAGIALAKIQALAGESGEYKAPPLSPPSQFPRPAVLEMTGVTHRYYGGQDERRFTLGPVDLTINPGELVFLIGGNGSGKTTLALLLVGLYVPEQGKIRLGGQLITQDNREYFRQQFSTVFSDFYLFDSLLGLQNRDLNTEALTYLTQLQLDHKVKIENGSFSTIDLSQGQRKRLALLVAYLEDRPFYLFDEWAADQDPIFKKVFYTEILPSLKARGKTIIVISHDDSYYHMADRCLVLQEGKLKSITTRPDNNYQLQSVLNSFNNNHPLMTKMSPGACNAR